MRRGRRFLNGALIVAGLGQRMHGAAEGGEVGIVDGLDDQSRGTFRSLRGSQRCGRKERQKNKRANMRRTAQDLHRSSLMLEQSCTTLLYITSYGRQQN